MLSSDRTFRVLLMFDLRLYIENENLDYLVLSSDDSYYILRLQLTGSKNIKVKTICLFIGEVFIN